MASKGATKDNDHSSRKMHLLTGSLRRNKKTKVCGNSSIN